MLEQPERRGAKVINASADLVASYVFVIRLVSLAALCFHIWGIGENGVELAVFLRANIADVPTDDLYLVIKRVERGVPSCKLGKVLLYLKGAYTAEFLSCREQKRDYSRSRAELRRTSVCAWLDKGREKKSVGAEGEPVLFLY